MYPYRSGSCGQDELPLERKGRSMKKLLTVFLALGLLVGTVGCPKKDDKAGKDKAKTPAADTGGKTADPAAKTPDAAPKT